MTDYQLAIPIMTSNVFPNRNGYDAMYVLIHGAPGSTTAQSIGRYFITTQGSSEPVSTHYVIGRDGEIVQCVSEDDGAFGNGVLTAGHAAFWDESINPNFLTISIEHCKPSLDNSDQLTEPQKAASFALIRDICNRRGIPKRLANVTGGITGHFSIDPINRARCPGAYPWNELFTFLQQEEEHVIDITTPGVAQYFVAIPNARWRCISNNFFVGGAILDWYCRVGNAGLNGITLLGLPLSNEIPTNKQGATYQRFERGIAAYDPKHQLDSPPGAGDIYLLHLNTGYGVDPRVLQYSTEIQQLQIDAKKATAEIDTLNTQLLAAPNVKQMQVLSDLSAMKPQLLQMLAEV